MQNTGLTNLNTLLTTPAKDTATILTTSIRNGESDEVQVGIALKKFKKLHDLIFDSKSNKDFKDIKETVEESILKYQEGDKTFSIYGAKITEASRGYWDYSNTDDPMLTALLEIQEEIKQRIKLRETYLQTKVAEYEVNNKPNSIMKFGIKPFTIIVEELPKLTMEEAYAEVTTIPPVKRSTTSLRFTL